MINVLYPILTAALFAAAFISGSALCLSAGCALVAAAVFSAVVTLRISKGVIITLKTAAVASKGAPVIITVQTENTGRIPTGTTSYLLKCENRLTNEKTSLRFRGGKRKIEIKSTFSGCIDISLEKIRIHDWFGVIAIPYKDKVSARTVIMPDTFPLEASNGVTSFTLKDTEEYSQTKKGQDRSETFGIREYEAGDPLSQIHWKLSGKLGQLIVREASLPVDHSLVLFFDRTKGKEDPAASDALCEAITSIGAAFASSGVPFEFVWNEATINSYDVEYEEDLTEAVMTMLKAGPTVKGESAAELYEKSESDKSAGKIYYFTRQVPDDISRLCTKSEVLIFNCSSDGSGCAGLENEIDFTPDTMKEVFTKLSLD